jgi:hypothetical protein
MDVLVAYANQKGWVTAKAGRPDTNRAGNARELFVLPLWAGTISYDDLCLVLRTLADGKIRWAFWPPDTPLMENKIRDGHGIWLGSPAEDDRSDPELSDEGSESDSEEEGDASEAASDSEGISEESESPTVAMRGRFSALDLEDPVESATDEES